VRRNVILINPIFDFHVFVERYQHIPIVCSNLIQTLDKSLLNLSCLSGISLPACFLNDDTTNGLLENALSKFILTETVLWVLKCINVPINSVVMGGPRTSGMTLINLSVTVTNDHDGQSVGVFSSFAVRGIIGFWFNASGNKFDGQLVLGASFFYVADCREIFVILCLTKTGLMRMKFWHVMGTEEKRTRVNLPKPSLNGCQTMLEEVSFFATFKTAFGTFKLL